jgi:putative aldouronate transport system substrate-binding protein
VEGRDYSIGADGNPVPTEFSNVDANSVPWKYLTQRPQVAYWPGIPDYAKAAIDFEKAVLPISIQDPAIGLSTPTFDKLGASLQQSLQDWIFDLVTGRRAMTEYEQVVSEWRSQGGEERGIRSSSARTDSASRSGRRQLFDHRLARDDDGHGVAEQRLAVLAERFPLG